MIRFAWATVACVMAPVVVVPTIFHPAPKLLWNASASVPIGLYAVRRAFPLHIGELVVVAPPRPLAQFLAGRRYLPLGVPLVKHILAVPGQTICRRERTVTINGTAAGAALDRDRLGRALPAWRGCRVLGTDEVFLMNRTPPDSLDGRYFGALPISTIVGRADPLWIYPEN
ncbi:MAG TPA: S26 family signal peptidase [Rhizomicrobium sp.]|jgi:conjugative transfer signal peptidase TraF|nr:S26 family signal peptidase [Rhizomicrobium sp.]